MHAEKPTSESPPWWMRIVIGRRPKRTLVRLIIVIVGSVVIFGFVLVPARIEGISMEPTYRDGRINFINRLAYVWSKPKRGDVVAIKTTGMHIVYLKRIIGLPGETYSIERGMVMINSRPLDEPYVVKREPWEEPPRHLADDEYLAIGDNRATDQFTHAHGVVKAHRIAGKILW
ncbi:MAG: signal peptidase I [Verrucomicrobia bacterium]|nr:signal peptidase I [Verrucomicrobiota bacterium]